jgi:hypothetical protein
LTQSNFFGVAAPKQCILGGQQGHNAHNIGAEGRRVRV